jgi:hypothetical protein
MITTPLSDDVRTFEEFPVQDRAVWAEIIRTTIAGLLSLSRSLLCGSLLRKNHADLSPGAAGIVRRQILDEKEVQGDQCAEKDDQSNSRTY